MYNTRKTDSVPIIDHAKIFTEAPRGCEDSCSQLWALKLQSMPLTLNFDQLLEYTHLGRSTAYQKMQEKHANFDRTFPQGVPLHDGDRSPRFWWSHEVVAWLMQRDQRAHHVAGAFHE